MGKEHHAGPDELVDSPPGKEDADEGYCCTDNREGIDSPIRGAHATHGKESELSPWLALSSSPTNFPTFSSGLDLVAAEECLMIAVAPRGGRGVEG